MPDLIRFDRAVELRSVSEPFLMRNETKHNLLLGLLSTLEADPNFYGESAYFGAVIENGEIVAVAIMTPPHNLVVSGCEDGEALTMIASDVLAFRRDTPGINAPVPTSLAFAEAWHRITGDRYEGATRQALRIYELGQLKPPAHVRGRARLADEADVVLLTGWYHAFAAEAVPSEAESMEETEKGVRRRLAMPSSERAVLIWEDGGPVSMAGYGNHTPHSLRIGPVYTPPEFRRRGYGSAVTAAACRHILDSASIAPSSPTSPTRLPTISTRS